ncbi:MAG: hypothetical protein LUG92_07300 [Oscillospiraceae bacterium]|nr:hypothetical protein [Oscillospiraceae bacterium]
MKKKNFVSLVMGAVGGVLFALGMCMALLPEWNAFTQGVVIGAVGAVILLAMLIVRRKMDGKPAVKLNGKAAAAVTLGVFGVLVLGAGMCLVMVYDMLLPGTAAGMVGILLLLALIPICRGVE